MNNLPSWEERQQPTFRMRDRHEGLRDYSVPYGPYPPSGIVYLDLVNQYKQPLNDAFRLEYQKTMTVLERRELDLAGINQAVAAILDSEPYPIHRIVSHQDLEGDPAYGAAAEEGFYAGELEFTADGELLVEFCRELGFIRLNKDFIENDHRINVTDAIAHSLSQAVLGRLVNVYYDEVAPSTISWSTFRTTSGYMWRDKDQWFGGLIDRAGAAKVAAMTRKEIGWSRSSKDGHPLIDQYQGGDKRVSCVAIGALALDIIGQTAGSDLPLYRTVWEFSKDQDEAARYQLASFIKFATNGGIKLEELEAVDYMDPGSSLALLSKVEEKCGIEPGKRVTDVLHIKDINI